jgi:hypothetical protein
MVIEMYLSDSAGIPLSRTIVERNSVKKVKLNMNPVTTPRGRRFPDVSTVDERMIGKIGNIHGERIVTTPAKKANTTSTIMLTLY